MLIWRVLLLFMVLAQTLLATCALSQTGTGTEQSKHKHKRGRYGWVEYRDLWQDASEEQSSLAQTAARLDKKLAQEELGLPVYVTLTTIHNRLHGVGATLETLIEGEMLPTHIYVFLSRGAFLLDQGVRLDFLRGSSTLKLRSVQRRFPHISIVFVENVGPHRKLLPLLERKWDEDCAIVTVDDHLLYVPTTLSSLVKYYKASGGNAVVARRARRMGLCSHAPPWTLAPYTRDGRGLWPETRPARRELLLLPTGTGGVLYRPRFFHPSVFDDGLRNRTATGDDLLFRLTTLARGVPVVTACSPDDTKFTCPAEDGLEQLLGLQEKAAAPALQRFFPESVDSVMPLYKPPTPSLTRRALKEGVELNSVPEAKKVSLATVYNHAVGGNNDMWLNAVDYLKELRVLDFPEVLQTMALGEREKCLLSQSVIARKKGGLIHGALLGLQSFYDRECGIDSCD